MKTENKNGPIPLNIQDRGDLNTCNGTQSEVPPAMEGVTLMDASFGVCITIGRKYMMQVNKTTDHVK